jgi:hypothetical protein
MHVRTSGTTRSPFESQSLILGIDAITGSLQILRSRFLLYGENRIEVLLEAAFLVDNGIHEPFLFLLKKLFDVKTDETSEARTSPHHEASL